MGQWRALLHLPYKKAELRACLQAQPAKAEKKRKVYKQLVLPTPEQMQQEDVMNNCGVRTVLSGVMGAGLGAVFGVFMVTMDAAVRATPLCLTRALCCVQARSLLAPLQVQQCSEPLTWACLPAGVRLPARTWAASQCRQPRCGGRTAPRFNRGAVGGRAGRRRGGPGARGGEADHAAGGPADAHHHAAAQRVRPLRLSAPRAATCGDA